MKKLFFLVALLLAIGAVLLGSGPALSAEQQGAIKTGVDFGPWHLEPNISVVRAHTSNYFKEASGELAEWSTQVIPEILVRLGKEDKGLEFFYQGQFTRNDEYTQYNADHHIARLQGQWAGDTGLQAKAAYEFRRQSNPPTFLGDAIKLYDDQNPWVELGWKFYERYGVTLSFNHTKRRFEDAAYNRDDFDRSDITLDLSWQALPKTTFFVESGWKQTAYPERTEFDFDNRELRVWLGARTTATALISGELKGGYLSKTWGSQVVGDDYALLGLAANLSYRPTKRTTVMLDMFRDIEDTQFSTSQSPEFGASFIRTGATLTLSQIIMRKFTVSLYAGLERDDYQENPEATGSARQDNKITGGLSLDYQFFKASYVGISYDYTNNDSNINDNDYLEHLFQIYLALGL